MSAPNVAPPRPRGEALFADEARFLAPGTQSIAALSRLAIDRGEGAVLYDVDGRSYLDLAAGVGVASLGHAHPKYVAALKRQLDRVHVGSFTTEHRAALVALLARLAPGDICRTQLYSGGAEAVEAAIRLARSHTGKREIIGFWGGFHGKTGGVLPILGSDFKHGLGPLAPGVPVSGILAREAVAFARPFANPSGSSSSFGGNPLAAAAARVTIETILEEGLVEHARELGLKMLAEIQRWPREIPIVAEPRGLGLMLGLSLVHPGTRRPLEASVTHAIFASLLSRGVLAMVYSPEVRLNPPLVIREDQAMSALAILREVLVDAAARLPASPAP